MFQNKAYKTILNFFILYFIINFLYFYVSRYRIIINDIKGFKKKLHAIHQSVRKHNLINKIV